MLASFQVSAQTTEPVLPAQPVAQVIPSSSEPEPEPASNETPAAGDDEWHVQVTPFVWLLRTRLAVSYSDRSLNTVITPSEEVSDLQFAVAGALAAQKGRWGVTGEGLYANMAHDVHFRRVTGSLRSNETFLQAAGSYR